MSAPDGRAVVAPVYAPTKVGTTTTGQPMYEWKSQLQPTTYLQFGSLVLNENVMGPALTYSLRCELEGGEPQ